MARFIPAIEPSSLTNSGERAVATALAALPDRYSIYHGRVFVIRERTSRGREFFREGEIDFILLDPQRGLLVLEVKGGTIQYTPERGYWRAETGEEIRDPFQQASDNMHWLMDRIAREPEFRGQSLSFVRGYAVVLPHCNWSGQLPLAVQPEMLLGYDAMAKMPEKINTLFELWSRVASPDPLPDWALRGIRAVLQATLNLLPVLAANVASQEESLRRATDEQSRVLESMREMRRVAFNGVAGSGKTLLALTRLVEFARAGQRALMLCFNAPLADWMRHWAERNIPHDLRANLWIGTFHGLCLEICAKAGQPQTVRANDSDFWNIELPDAMESIAKTLPLESRYDAIVVDEGQDFSSLWYPGLRALSKSQDDDFPLYWFFDPRQNVYRLQKPTDIQPGQPLKANLIELPPNMAGPFLLVRNCRNTRRISSHCGQIIGEEFKLFEQSPEGEEVRELSVSSPKEMIRLVREQVLEWMDRGGRLRPNQIAILTPQKPSSDWPDRIGTVPLSDDLERWRRGECILLATHRRFKGLETDALVLADIPEPGTRNFFGVADFYVASSRAKHHLTVIRRNSETAEKNS